MILLVTNLGACIHLCRHQIILKTYNMSKKYILLILSLIFLISCSNEDSPSSQTNNSVWEQKTNMLSNWTDNFIIPYHDTLLNNLNNLESAAEGFATDMSLNNLELLRNQWLTAYKSWQYVEMFNIGPAEQSFYYQKMNVYPANISKITELIGSGDFTNLNNSPFYSAQGFPALDYLLFGLASNDQSLLNLFSSNDKYFNYMNEVIDRMISNTNYVINGWTSYKQDFVNSVENTATSSANKITNDFIFYYEKGFRSNKFGIPIGIFSGGNIFPEKVEGYYNRNVSRTLALEALTAIEEFFTGKGGYSLKGFIDNFATGDNSNLSNQIIDQFNTVRFTVNQLDSSFVTQINEDLSSMNATYDIIQTGTVLLKTDMLSVLQIATDYVDADGD